MNTQPTSKNIFANVRKFVPRNNKNIMDKPAIKFDDAGYENVTNPKSVRDVACLNNMHIGVIDAAAAIDS